LNNDQEQKDPCTRPALVGWRTLALSVTEIIAVASGMDPTFLGSAQFLIITIIMVVLDMREMFLLRQVKGKHGP
jgi:hypothetical protein